MPSVRLCPLFNTQTVTNAGAPASGYKIYTYAAGSTAPQSTYTDNGGTVPQSNPIILNSSGYPTTGQVWLQAGLSYKFVLQDSLGNTIKTFDNISGINDSSITVTQWLSSGATPTYLSASTFSVPGDQTNEFHIGRRLQLTTTAGTVYGVITGSVYGTVTTVTVSLDSGVLDSGLSAVNLAILRNDYLALPLIAGRLLNIQKFTSSGTYTPTAGTTSVVVEVQGGGGAGGGAPATGASTISLGVGGASGSYGKGRYTSGFSGVAVTVGAGGVGASGAAGGNGGTSSFGALLSAPGGPGGGASGPAAPGYGVSGGGAATSPSGANLVSANGSPGGYAMPASGAFTGGPGASSVFGGGAPITSIGTNGVSAAAPGAGGSGATQGNNGVALAGGNGAAGIVIVHEYA